jgi:hypothetical protein
VVLVGLGEFMGRFEIARQRGRISKTRDCAVSREIVPLPMAWHLQFGIATPPTIARDNASAISEDWARSGSTAKGSSITYVGR